MIDVHLGADGGLPRLQPRLNGLHRSSLDEEDHPGGRENGQGPAPEGLRSIRFGHSELLLGLHAYGYHICMQSCVFI
ncbi:hypothetical protein AUQ37_06885 [Candidatus Methanomethylophilus sp. 1R26]|nr:hypothetical protein AUQ37_06885 [Candidatus Methanomethylophilus sp. 1R26]